MEWISIEERLPAQQQIVLAVIKVPISPWNETGMQLCAMMLYGDIWFAQEYASSLCDESSYKDDNDYVVTHWMPLPEPPKV